MRIQVAGSVNVTPKVWRVVLQEVRRNTAGYRLLVFTPREQNKISATMRESLASHP